MVGQRIGYIRVSTIDQNVERQLEGIALDRTFIDKASGKDCAAAAPAIPTGFWDRRPQPTPGRLRRLLARTPFPQDFPLPARLREKASATAHLPKGFWEQRRTPATPATPTTLAEAT